MPEFFKNFLSAGGFIPHGHCYLWKPGLVLLHVASDSLIGLAYYSIPVMLVYFVRSRRDVPFDWIFLMFGSFIVACGTTHLLEVWTLWHPTYWLSGFVKAITALVSLSTAALLVPLIPKALALPSPAQLEAANLALRNEITQRQLAEEALQEANEQLEFRVQERTAKLALINESLQAEIESHKRTEQALLRRTRQLEILSRASLQINSVLEIPAIMRTLVASGMELVGTASGTYGLMSQGKMFFPEYNENGIIRPIDVTLERGVGVAGWVMETRCPYVANDAENDPHVLPQLQKAFGFYNLVNIPIFNRNGELIGSFDLHNKADRCPFSDNDLTMLQGLAASAAVALENAQMIVERNQIQEALRTSEQRFRATFNQAAVGIAQVGIDGQWLLVNQKLCDIIGYTREELLERSFQDITHPDDLDADFDYVRQMLAGEIQTYSMEKRYICKDTSQVWINLTVSLVRDSSDEPQYFIFVVEDISDRKQREQEVRLLQTITQGISEAPNFNSALRVALYKVCEATGWNFGEVWIPHCHENLLELSPVWCSSVKGRCSRHEKIEQFRRESEKFTFSLNTALPGRVWVSKQPEWIQDVSLQPETEFLRSQMAQEAGLKAALGVPIIANISDATVRESQVLAVFVFFTFESCEEDKRLVELVSSVANQLGLVIQRKRSEEALKKSHNLLQAVIEGTPDAILVKDLQGRYVMLNSAVARIQGKPKSEILGRDDSELFGLKTGLLLMETDRCIMTTGETKLLEESVLIGGTLRTYLSTKSVWRDAQGKVIGLIVIARDITHRKRAEQEIRELNQNLERRVIERTAELEAANKELEAFSYSVSHDLRAPLRGIDGFSKTLLDRYGDKLDEKGKHYLQRVRAGTQRMGELIDDLLKLSRVTRSEMHRTRVDLSIVAKEIAAELMQTQPQRQVEWAIAPGLVADGDARLLRIVLENLLNNSWKFTSLRIDSRIEFNATLQEDGKIAYFVRDNGAGFDMAYANKLFGAFARLHSTTQFPGTGIGLATVQRIIHRHGGRVWAQGAVEQGATFYFTL